MLPAVAPDYRPNPKSSFSHPENIALMIKLGLVRPDADHFDFYMAWGKILRARIGHSSNDFLKRITPAQLARLKEEIAGNVLPFSPKHGTPKVEQ